MDLHHLRCFVAAAEELHFGRAAQRLDMLPSALGRFIRLLEEDLGTRLMTRTTRSGRCIGRLRATARAGLRTDGSMGSLMAGRRGAAGASQRSRPCKGVQRA